MLPCGGPGLCAECSREKAELARETEAQALRAAAWPRYRCHKIVAALKIRKITVFSDGTAMLHVQRGFRGIKIDPKLTTRYMPVAGDYLVEYEDGYRSISPAKAFEDGYTLIEEPNAPIA